ncbi:MAG TPA: response regulator [Blastocatellia bacterium]|nr:response regulator [Blastocatellia bacterium]
MSKKMGILVIDDEPTVCDALKMILSDSGYEVAIAPTGREGLDKIHRQRFAATITDICLPDTSGLTVLSQIREQDPNSLVIVMTAHNVPEIVAESLKRGALGVLSKPFPLTDLLDLLNRTLNERPPLA